MAKDLQDYQLRGISAVVADSLKTQHAPRAVLLTPWAGCYPPSYAREVHVADDAPTDVFGHAVSLSTENHAGHTVMVSVEFCSSCRGPYWMLRDRDAACCSRCREAKAPARHASLVAALEAKQRELPVSAFDRRAASEAWSAGVRAAVARLEEEKRAADARRLGWDPELTGGEE